jgi:GNAT superfamily N-acetyltransferase
MDTGYLVVERTPSVAEYNRIRNLAGLGIKDELAAEHGLAGTLYAVCIEHGGVAIGIGRVIGDGGLFFDVVDVAVVAEHWKKGVGTLIMEALMTYVGAHARPSSLICLMANRGVAPFYEKFGFKARDPDMPGMIIRK